MKNTSNLNSPTICERPRAATLVCHTTGHNDKGQALLELALVLPFLLLLLIGAVEFGIIAYASIEVANAAEAGAMYGAQNRATALDTTGITTAAQNDAANLATLTVTSSTSCACQTGTFVVNAACATVATSCATPSRIIQWVQVNTSSTINPSFHYPGVPPTFALTGHATMRVGQ